MGEPNNCPLEPKDGWQINPLRRCWERGSGDDLICIYPGPYGFSVAVAEAWQPDLWPTFEEAAQAAEREVEA